MMKRVVVQADEKLLARAKRHATRRGISFAQLVRDALEREVGSDRARIEPAPRSLGMFRSGRRDGSERVSRDEYEPDQWRSS